MTVDETVAALQKFDPKFKIIKNYWANNVAAAGQTGTPLQNLSAFVGLQGEDPQPLTAKFAFLNDLVAEIATPLCVSEPLNSGDPCAPVLDQRENDIVQVWFVPIPGQERVIAIQRTQEYPDDPADDPAYAAVVSAIFSKYPAPPSISQTDGYQYFDWIYDAKGNFLSPDRIRELHNAGKAVPEALQGGLPEASAGDGITLSFSLNSNGQNSTTVSKIMSSLSDGNALFLATAQGQATFDAQKAKMLAASAK